MFKELGLIEQWGSGIQRMTAACREAGLGPPEFEEITHFRVTLRAAPVGRPAVDAVDQAILDALRKSAGLATHEVARKIKRSERATRTRLGRLVERGLVVEIGTGPNDPRRRYAAGHRLR